MEDHYHREQLTVTGSGSINSTLAVKNYKQTESVLGGGAEPHLTAHKLSNLTGHKQPLTLF